MKLLLAVLQLSQIAATLVIAKLILSLSLPTSITQFSLGVVNWFSGSDASPELQTTAPVQNVDIESPGAATVQPKYDRVVVMLVDALREDMVFKRPEMEYVRGLLSKDAPIRQGEKTRLPTHNHERCSIGYIGKAHTPTVTMPRIKAITTGGVPQFIDALNNLDSGSLNEDNLITRLSTKNKTLVLYGDETWLKLFPGHFQRHDGTSSFFTKDFTEVDLNVTRHFSEDFDPELIHPNSRDWDAVVLHYLGLDHIGHQHGPDAVQMHVKLQEMDRTFERLHTSLLKQEQLRHAKDPAALPTLLVLLSDHGMNQGGNHGGASEPETSAVSLFFHVSSEVGACDSEHIGDMVGLTSNAEIVAEEVLQVDLAPTLGQLLGVGIPHTSVGKMLCGPFLLGSDSGTKCGDSNQYKQSLWLNAVQLTKYLQQKSGGSLSQDVRSLLNAVPPLNTEPETKDVGSFVALIDLLQERLREAVSGGNVSDSNVLLFFALVALLSPVLTAPVAVYMTNGIKRIANTTFSDLYLVSIFIVHGIALTSSSAIENEYVVWFHFTTTWLVIQWMFALKRRASISNSDLMRPLVALVLLRVLRVRLQVINFSTLNNLSGIEVVNESTSLLSIPSIMQTKVAATLGILLVHVKVFLNCTVKSGPIATTLVISAIGLVALKSGVILELLGIIVGQSLIAEPATRIVWEAYMARVILAGIFACSFLRSRSEPVGKLACDTIAQVALLLHRSGNASILSIVFVLFGLLSESGWVENVPNRCLALWALGQCAFFATGNSHVMSTVDISGAYTGLLEYNQYIVGVFTGIIVFVGPVLATAFIAKVLVENTRDAKQVIASIYILHSLRFFITSMMLVQMRSHLFVWSVFAPKWAYEVLQFVVMSLGMWCLSLAT